MAARSGKSDAGITASVKTQSLKAGESRMLFREHAEFLFLSRGSAEIGINGEKYCLIKGRIVCIGHEDTCEIIAAYGDITAVSVYFDPQAFGATHFVYGLSGTVFGDGTRAVRLAEEICRELGERAYGYELGVQAGIIGIIRIMLRESRESSDREISEKQADGQAGFSKSINDALPYISENFRSITERQAARYCNVSYSYFSRSFKAAARVGFSDYISGLRLDEAQRLLLTSDMTVTDIAMDLGFSTSSHFISRFRKKTGLSPGQFRIKYRKNAQ